MSKPVRVRFAPSPTGGLHLGGVRTALYNYLFARKYNGKFILRIEDTDQARFVPGAEEYIMNCLKWCGIEPDESPVHGGSYAPYRQSERKSIYREYAEQLVQKGYAYYAFDTPHALEVKRKEEKNFQYNHTSRGQLDNSLTKDEDHVRALIEKNTPYVIRIKMPENEEIKFTDMIRGEISFNSSEVDDKVLLKADGMPTYHLAVVVDDYMMKISHVFRGEEWLNSTPVHLLLWKYLGWESYMPQWAHLPLILGSDGSKLSKRHGNKYGFPIFGMNWMDASKGELTEGFKERGFLPEAFINLLAVLGWSDGTAKELFTKEELIAAFTMEHVHRGGAQFDFEKAKWYNHEWIKMSDNKILSERLIQFESEHYIKCDINYLQKVVGLIKDRCTLLSDFWQHGSFFFRMPETIDTSAIKPRWSEEKNIFFNIISEKLLILKNWIATDIEVLFKETAAERSIKMGELQLPLRIMLVGGKFGPGVFEIAELLGKEETIKRIHRAIKLI